MATDYKALKNGGFMRQVQKNHFSLRLKVVGGNLTAGQLVVIAETAKKYGDGHVHLTARQGVEIPFIKLDDVESVKKELVDGGVFTGVCGPVCARSQLARAAKSVLPVALTLIRWRRKFQTAILAGSCLTNSNSASPAA